MAICASSSTSASNFRLNPDAPVFFPASFSAIEDFSSEWWHNIQSSLAFREYWISNRFDPEEMDPASDFVADDLVDFETGLPDDEQYISPFSTQSYADLCPNGMDVKEYALLTGWKCEPEEKAAKIDRPPFSPLPHHVKPLKVAQPQKAGIRKIQQPR